MRSIATYIAALCGWAFFAAMSQAQVQGGGYLRPAVSPYLQLNLAGQAPGLNYYGIVRPQIAANRLFLNLGTELATLDATTATLQNGGLSQTGHPSSFMTHYKYFMNNGASNRTGRPGQGLLQGQGQGQMQAQGQVQGQGQMQGQGQVQGQGQQRPRQ